MKIITGKKCPYCNVKKSFRHRRLSWMRWIPRSRYYECSACDGRYLTVFQLIVIGVKKGKNITSGDVNQAT